MARRSGWCSLLLVVLSVLLAGAGACDRGQTEKDEPAEASDSDDPTAKAVDSEQEDPEQGEPCEADPECELYLRCIDHTCQTPPAMTGEADESTPSVAFVDPEADAGGSVASFHVELVTSIPQRRRGLMYRDTMKENWGMLFVYPDEAPRSFWMKNTYIPLDMVFMGADGRIVKIIESATPRTTTPRPSEKPARFVLELTGGRADEVGLRTGLQMDVEKIPDKHAPQP